MAVVKTISNQQFEMDYCLFGEGKKCFVILPGLSLKPVTTSADAIEAGFQIFKDEYQVYLFDRKKNPQLGYSLEMMAEDTYMAMREAGIEKASIFGASQGGMMAQLIAINHPDFVERLVLGSTLAKENPTAKTVIETWITYAKSHDLDGLNKSFAQKVYCKETLEAFGEVILAGNKDVTEKQMDDFVALASSISGFDILDRLNQIACPTLVLGANNDEVVTRNGSIEIAQKLGCQLFMYDNYGHGVYDEASDYRSRILEFISK